MCVVIGRYSYLKLHIHVNLSKFGYNRFIANYYGKITLEPNRRAKISI
jgi:hypothetical protein